MFDVLRNPFWADGPVTLVFDLAALGIIAFHGMNGIRIVFLDLGLDVRRDRTAFWIAMLAALTAPASVIILGLPVLP